MRYRIFDNGLRISDFFYSPNKKSPDHYDQRSRLSIVLSGALLEKAGQQSFIAEPMSFVLKPNSVEHSNEYGNKGARIISIDWTEELSSTFLTDQYKNTYRWFANTSNKAASIQLLKNIYAEEDAEQILGSMIELFAGVEDIVLCNSKSAPLWLQKLAEQLEEEYDQNLQVQDLAKQVGVHPVYLARIFRKYYHASIKAYLLQIRLNRAIIQIANQPELSLAQVAYDMGFADQSHLNRLFKRELKIAPGKFRNLTHKVSFVQESKLTEHEFWG